MLSMPWPRALSPTPDSAHVSNMEAANGRKYIAFTSVELVPTHHPEHRILNHMSIVKNVAAIARGMSVTLGEMFKPTEVENYPDGPGPMRGAHLQERFRGKHQLQRDENGLEKCVACFLCAAACPSNCIYIEAAENTEEKRISSSERYAKVYNIDYNRCIFCGYCVEACPTDAITHGHGFKLATFNASNLVYRKEALLVPMPANAGQPLAPPEPVIVPEKRA